MLKKTITYTDYDGEQRTEDFYFALSKAELIEMQYSENGGLEKLLEKIVKEKDTKRMVELFKSVILKAYGQKSLDGRRFIKNPELTEEFVQTPAYSELFMELATNDKTAAEFINRILPQDLAAQMNERDSISAEVIK